MSQSQDTSSQDETIVLPPTALRALSRVGLRPETIASALDLPVSRVRTTITRHVLPPEEEQLAAKIRGLYLLAIQEAHKTLEFGPTEQKMMIIKSLLGGNAIRFASASGGRGEEMRQELDELFAEVRTVPKSVEVVTETGIEEEEIGAKPITALEQADDQD